MKLGITGVENLKTLRKSKAKKHGGARRGAGRKPTPRASSIPVRMARGDMSAQDRARAYLDLAIETLAGVASAGASEAARVSAARAIVEIAAGKLRAPQGDARDKPGHDDPDDGWDDLLKSRQPASRNN